MKSIKNFFRELKSNNVYQIVFFFVSISLILGAYAGLRLKIQNQKEREYTIGVHHNLINYIEDADVTDKFLTLLGWCFYIGADSSQNQVQVFLRNVEDEEDVVWLDVAPIVRTDVNTYYDSDVDYSQTGFEARGEIEKLALDTKDYEIFIKLSYVTEGTTTTNDSEEKAVTEKKYVKTVSTKRYLCNGVLTACLPKDGPLVTESELLNEIFEQGQLLLYREDQDVYVYQYGAQLYWITGKDFYFAKSGMTKIQFQLGTTRIDKLPAKRQENGDTWDNVSFYFENNEIKLDTTTPYRVAVCDIPTAYPITHFWTGYYKNSAWVWKEYLVPDIFSINKLKQ